MVLTGVKRVSSIYDGILLPPAKGGGGGYSIDYNWNLSTKIPQLKQDFNRDSTLMTEVFSDLIE